MDWISVAAIASPFITAAGILAMRNEAQQVAREIVTEAIAAALDRFKLELLEEMNGKYLRTREQLADNESFQRQIDKLDRDVQVVASSLVRRIP